MNVDWAVMMLDRPHVPVTWPALYRYLLSAYRTHGARRVIGGRVLCSVGSCFIAGWKWQKFAIWACNRTLMVFVHFAAVGCRGVGGQTGGPSQTPCAIYSFAGGLVNNARIEGWQELAGTYRTEIKG